MSNQKMFFRCCTDVDEDDIAALVGFKPKVRAALIIGTGGIERVDRMGCCTV